MNQRKNTLIKLVLVTVPLLLIVFLIYLAINRFLPDFIPIVKTGDEAEIEAYIRQSGSFGGAAITVALQFFQVVSIVFPGLPIQVAAGIIFGWFRGYLICQLSYVAANMVVFAVSRFISSRIKSYVYFENSEKRLKFISESECPEYMVFLACMMPLIPNGIVPYVAARTSVSFKRFSIAVFLGSAPTIFLLCLLGNNFLSGSYWLSIVIFVLLGAAIILMYIFRNKTIDYIKRVRAYFLRLKKRR